ncbi:AI-2E family transporter [Bacillus sp. FJAT-27251]|uniref:AI-2E family transporter n=1 Tax=Bacillus sp. FJAT-27251 TaxID=1684142 RepID=UPI0006A7EBA7|nr:AI-2E family transporter [Bacillus sp. FJAT-27251]
MDIPVKWFYRLGFLLLLFIVLYIFLKLQALWIPVLRVGATLLLPFAIGGFIAYLLHPVVERLHGRGLHRGVSVLIIYLLFFGGAGIVVYEGTPLFIHQLRDLSENIPFFASQYREWLLGIEYETSRWPPAIQERIEEGITGAEAALEGILASIMEMLKGFLNFLVLIAIIPFIAFYMLKDFGQMKRFAWYMTPSSWRDRGRHFLREVDTSLGSYIRGQLLVCLIIGVLSALLFLIAGMPYSLLLGLIVGITNVIPYFGPIIGAVPAVIIAATISMKMVVTCVIIVFALQFLEGNILSPLIVGKSLHMHPLVIMLALLAGGEIGGVAGLILAVPVLVILRAALLHAKDYIRMKREQIP